VEIARSDERYAGPDQVAIDGLGHPHGTWLFSSAMADSFRFC
jgi:hypothetical protein